jgi:endo-1,4-beta-xylanase
MFGKYLDLLKHHYNVITSSCTYPQQLAPANKGGAYRFTDADNIINIARRNNIPVFGHVLIWHEATPAWLTEGSREEVLQNMNDYITTVLRHFRGRIYAWDVVNEAIKELVTAAEARGDWRRCVRNTQNPWFDKLGVDYIELAFRAARVADPNIILYYNDYGLEDPNKAEVARKMIQDINDRYKRETGGTRNLIEGIGSQSHVYAPYFNINNHRRALEILTRLGIEIAISELDIFSVFERGTGRDTVMFERDEIAQALIYARLFNLYKEFSAHITRVTFWGMSDNTSWLSSNNPTLFDWGLNAKQAFHAVSDPDGFIRQHGGRTRR